MNRKRLTVMVSCLIVALFVVYTVLDERWVRYTMVSDMDGEVFHSIDELIAFSPIIVEATATANSVPFLIKEGNLERPLTKTDVIVHKVIKGDVSKGRQGEAITLIENYYTPDTKELMPGKTIFTYGDYTKLVPGAKYQLFLAWSDIRGGYWIVAGQSGKMNLDNKDVWENELASRNAYFSNLKNEAAKKSF